MRKDYLGLGSLDQITGILEDIKGDRIFLVKGKNSFIDSGAKDVLAVFFKDKQVIDFTEFTANPKIEDVCLGIEKIRKACVDLVIAVGGGSVIDMAKLVNILAFQEDSAKDIILGDKKIEKRGLPLIAIPTTAGSGSEATRFGVVYIDKVKYSLEHDFMKPDYAIVEPFLSYSMSERLTAITGFDALSQAIESYWSINSNETSKKYAAKAIKLGIKNLENAVRNPDNLSRKNMTEAAHLAGKAIDITRTTAAHAVSYSITAYHNIPHGHAVALTLGKFFVINAVPENAELNEQRGEDYLKQTMQEICDLFDCTCASEFSSKWYDFMTETGLENNFKELGIDKKADIERIIKNVNISRLGNNPVKINQALLKQVFNSI